MQCITFTLSIINILMIIISRAEVNYLVRVWAEPYLTPNGVEKSTVFSACVFDLSIVVCYMERKKNSLPYFFLFCSELTKFEKTILLHRNRSDTSRWENKICITHKFIFHSCFLTIPRLCLCHASGKVTG